jgi:hypothetical protein
LVVVLVPFGLAFGENGHVKTVEELRASVVDWTQQLKSFRGSYVITQDHFGGNNKALRREFNIHYRFQSGNRFMHMEETTENIEPSILTEVLYEGVSSYRLDRGSSGNRGEVMLHGKGWQWPRGVFMYPDEIFRQDFSESNLAELLRYGTLMVVQKDGQYVLSDRCGKDMQAADVDIWFDNSNRIEKIEWCFRFNIAKDEEISEIFPDFRGDLFDLQIVRSVFELGWYN